MSAFVHGQRTPTLAALGAIPGIPRIRQGLSIDSCFKERCPCKYQLSSAHQLFTLDLTLPRRQSVRSHRLFFCFQLIFFLQTVL